MSKLEMMIEGLEYKLDMAMTERKSAALCLSSAAERMASMEKGNEWLAIDCMTYAKQVQEADDNIRRLVDEIRMLESLKEAH